MSESSGTGASTSTGAPSCAPDLKIYYQLLASRTGNPADHAAAVKLILDAVIATRVEPRMQKLLETLPSAGGETSYPTPVDGACSDMEVDDYKKPTEPEKSDFKQKHDIIIAILNSAEFLDDKNYIGKLNIIMLQFALLFTTVKLNYVNPSRQAFHSPDFFRFYQIFMSIEWTNYSILKDTLLLQSSNLSFFSSLYSPFYEVVEGTEPLPMPVFLITNRLYMSVPLMIEYYLDNLIVNGFSTTGQLADGTLTTPFEFVSHDLDHGNAYVLYITSKQLNLADIKNFYEYCKTQRFDEENKKILENMLFYLLHEIPITADYFPRSGQAKELFFNDVTKYNLKVQLTTNRVLVFFLDTNNLFKILPQEVIDRLNKLPGNAKLYQNGSAYTIVKEHLTQSVNLYMLELEKWYDQQNPGAGGASVGGKKRRLMHSKTNKNKNKKVSKRKSKRNIYKKTHKAK
jgi:hypothetical protein